MFLATKFDTVCKQHCKEVLPPAVSLKSPSVTDASTDRQQNESQLYCGYCNIRCMGPAGLVKHCKRDRHKHAVFADCGRDVLWQFEPPPIKEGDISTAIHG